MVDVSARYAHCNQDVLILLAATFVGHKGDGLNYQ